MLTEQREAFSEQSQHCELHPSKAAESLSLTHPGKVKGSSSVRNCKQIKKKKKRNAAQGDDGLLLWWVLMPYLAFVFGSMYVCQGFRGPAQGPSVVVIRLEMSSGPLHPSQMSCWSRESNQQSSHYELASPTSGPPLHCSGSLCWV